MTYELVKFIEDDEKRMAFITECLPFFEGMYTEKEKEIFGDEFFRFDYWLSIWDRGGGYLMTKRNADGKLIALGVITQYTDLWYNRNRLEINRYAVHVLIEDPVKEVQSAFQYLIENKGLIGYDFLYYVVRDEQGSEHKILRYPQVNNGDSR